MSNAEATSNVETSFLKYIANCLGREKPIVEAPERKEVGPPSFWKENDISAEKALELFTSNLEKLSGRVYLAKSKDEAKEKLREWVEELQARTVLAWDHPDLNEIVDEEFLGIHVVQWNQTRNRENLKDIASQVEVGVTWIDYAIGYTGTMAVFSGPKQGRSVSLLPPNHIAVFNKSQLVPTMSIVIEDIAKRKGTENMPSSINFITGPSRTSDIEMDLSIGVHGPFKTWAIIIDD